jgi:hypothetical protein
MIHDPSKQLEKSWPELFRLILWHCCTVTHPSLSYIIRWWEKSQDHQTLEIVLGQEGQQWTPWIKFNFSGLKNDQFTWLTALWTFFSIVVKNSWCPWAQRPHVAYTQSTKGKHALDQNKKQFFKCNVLSFPKERLILHNKKCLKKIKTVIYLAC